MEKLNIAVVGATGAVGEAMREILGERSFPAEQVFLLASERSVGKRFKVGVEECVLKGKDFH